MKASTTWALLSWQFALISAAVYYLGRVIDSNQPGGARQVLVLLIALGASVGWLVRGALDRRHLRRLEETQAELVRSYQAWESELARLGAECPHCGRCIARGTIGWKTPPTIGWAAPAKLKP